MSQNLKALIGKLNNTCRQALDGAAALCVSRSHYDVEIEHFLVRLLDLNGADFASITGALQIDAAVIGSQLHGSLEQLKSGNGRKPAFAPTLVRMFSEAWSIASLEFDANQIRSGFAILALLRDEELSELMVQACPEFRKIDAAKLEAHFDEITRGSYERHRTNGQSPTTHPHADGAANTSPNSSTPNLDQFTTDLTERARAGKIDAVLARDFEIRQMIDILTRRRQNNPILVGEAGVGKTAVVEGLAIQIVRGEVPAPLLNVRLRSLDLALLQAGAGVKGEFENRLKNLIKEITNSPFPIVLFIDEAHTMIGAGGQAGQNDAANLLKPALARGELRTVAATTWSEYKKYFEKDPALTRRFQVVKVEQPSEKDCQSMLRGVVSALESHHGVRVLDDGLAAAVSLSNRYLPDRQLPDKAVSVLDTACARLNLDQAAVPAAVERLRREIADLNSRRNILEREQELGDNHQDTLDSIRVRNALAQADLEALERSWQIELRLVAQIRNIHQQIEAAPSDQRDLLREQLRVVSIELEVAQGQQGMLRVSVDRTLVEDVISGWTGIPVGKLLKDDLVAVLDLERQLETRIIGQNHALHTISERVRTTKANMDDPLKPVGVFLLVGPSGVGKTETALALADLLYGGEENVININMSEFKEAHTVSTLKGAPPGYKGFGEGGRLTEAVRRRPYSVVLLDEVEKAHPDVLEMFFQVFDKGRMEDGEGREIIFRNCIIILTSNAGTDTIMRLTADPETMPDPSGLVSALKPELDKVFKPAFLGRTVIIPYYPVRDEKLQMIIKTKLAKIERRLGLTHGISLAWSDDVVAGIARRCTEVESGARNVDNILTNTVLPDISRWLLARMADGTKMNRLHIGVDESEGFVYSGE